MGRNNGSETENIIKLTQWAFYVFLFTLCSIQRGKLSVNEWGSSTKFPQDSDLDFSLRCVENENYLWTKIILHFIGELH